jgi:hypothetical protein
MAKYKLGGIPVDLDNANAGIPTIHPNHTIIMQQLTSKPSRNPDVVKGLKTEEQVFEHFKPSVKVAFQNADGKTIKEEIPFEHRGHFGKKGLVEQSDFLQGLESESKDLAEMIKTIKADRFLQKAMLNSDSKEAFIKGLKAMINILNEADK